MIRYTNIGYASSSTNDSGFYSRPKYISTMQARQRDRNSRCTVYDDIEVTDISKLLSLFQIPMKFDSGNPRPLESIVLDVIRKYTSTHDPYTSGMLIDLAERINKIVLKSLESGMDHSEITADILVEPEVDDTKLDAFLQEFTVKEG